MIDMQNFLFIEEIYEHKELEISSLVAKNEWNEKKCHQEKKLVVATSMENTQNCRKALKAWERILLYFEWKL